MAGLFGFLGGQQRKGNPTLDGRGYIDPAIDGLYSRSLGGQGGYGTPPTAPDQRPQSSAPDPSRRLFGDGHIGGIIGGLGKILTYGPFVGMAQEGINRRRDRQGLEDAYRKAQIDHLSADDPQVVNLGNGGVAQFTHKGGLSILREPEKLATTPTLQQNIEYIRSLNPKLTPEQLAEIARQSMSGYGNSQEAIDAKTAAALKVKTAPTYGALHPKAPGSAKTTATRVVGGQTYYKVGGAWYDNPEGR